MRLSSLSTGYLSRRSNTPSIVSPSTSNILPPQLSTLPYRHTSPPIYKAPSREELMYLNSNFRNTTQLSPLLMDTNLSPNNSATNTTTHTSSTSLSLIPSTSLMDQGRVGLPMAPDPPQTVHTSARIVLAKNYFQFADGMYHQIQGTAMGTKMAPAYANLFMAQLEEKLLENYSTKPILWKRYIDDVLCLWPGSPNDLKIFIDYLNRAHPTIKFTYECSNASVDFLDLTIYKGDRYKTTHHLDIKPFFKTTNKFQYLSYSSAHPRMTFSSLIKGESTRLLRACSSEDEYNTVQNKMFQAFKDRGYPAKLIKRIQNSVQYTQRKNILDPKQKPPCPYDTFLVLEYTPDIDANEIRTILKPTTTEEQHVPRPCLSLKRSQSINKKLVRAKLKNCENPPSSTDPLPIYTTPDLSGYSGGCGTPYCKCCKAMSRKCRITSSHNNKSFPIAKHTNCTTKNVIYLLECTKCSKRNQYVGQTQRNLSKRLAGHRAASKIKNNLPIYKHFLNSPNHNFETDVKLTILEKTALSNLDNRERHWINTLETVYPKGLNSRYE